MNATAPILATIFAGILILSPIGWEIYKDFRKRRRSKND